jgi:hypothetical protein
MEFRRFRLFERRDGSKVACQVDRVLYVTKGEYGATLHFDGGSQVNVTESFDQVLESLAVESA